MQKSKASIFLWSVIALLGVTLTGCLKTSEPQPQAAKAYVSMMHLATKAPAFPVQIYFNDTLVSSSFDPGGVSQTYSPVNTGIFAIKFKKNNSDSLIASIPAAIYDSLGFYSIVLYNEPAGTGVNAMMVEDDFSDLTLDKPYFRFWHLSPSVNDLGLVDLYIDNNKVFSQRSLADNEFSGYYNGFTASTAGYHKFEAKVNINGADSVLYTLDNVNLLAGNAYTLYLAGNVGGTGANTLGLGVLRAAN